jgi:hypothetical protein
MDDRFMGDGRFTGEDRLSGVELLALYGDDDRLGRIRIRMPKIGQRIKKAARYTPAGLAFRVAKKAATTIKRRRRLKGDDRFIGEDLLFEDIAGSKKKKPAKKKKKFLPGLTKGIRKVGKVTSGFTTGIAKTVGIPAPLLKAFSKLDPTKKKQSGTEAVQALIPVEKEVVPVAPGATGIDVKKIAIVGGGAVAALVVLKFALSSPRRG